MHNFQLEHTASAAGVSSLTWLGSDSVDPGDHQGELKVVMFNTLTFYI